MEQKNKIIGLLVEPNKLPRAIEIQNTLEDKQCLVAGMIECFYLPNDNGVVGICNEEGKILGLELNRDIGHDIIAGPFLLFGDDYENGEFKSLTTKQIIKYMDFFGQKSIDKTKNKVERILNNLNRKNEERNDR